MVNERGDAVIGGAENEKTGTVFVIIRGMGRLGLLAEFPDFCSTSTENTTT